jgi:ABC-2 type transport system permease protein
VTAALDTSTDTSTDTVPWRVSAAWLGRYYVRFMRVAVLQQFQYRAANYFYMIGMIAEPVVYLVVWSTIARSNGGSVSGFTAGTFAAYYVVWTLVRNINIVFTPFGWEQRIKDGELAGLLLQPIHPIHRDLAYFAGMKVVVIVLWVPIAVALTLVFHPALSPSPLQCVVFFLALWGAYLIRSMFLWALGLVSLWTTRVSAIFEAYFMAELLLSGRLVPLALMPRAIRTLAAWLPFQSTFGFPITALTGPISDHALVRGLVIQVLWILVGTVLVRFTWRRGIRRFSAVGG